MKIANLRTYRTLIVTAAALAVSACAGNPTQRANAEYSDDTSINAKVQAAVLGVPGIHADTIQLTTQDAVVTLRGTAANTLAARNAVQAARQVDGVKTVDYDIKVTPE
ncbi:BON domain-containing protein [Candidimonas sp. SYP-B2681]|uniref:BON domain-containing protein n=1 Tax=Candidimonas sp. SYP-B2681 TaxID=2497686 RepID=UPI0013157658|nr:BON domain-containing protein [Candidimonas sp. SYP-B2681]